LASLFEFNSTLASKQHENLATADHAWVKVAAVGHLGGRELRVKLLTLSKTSKQKPKAKEY
jgi:hypothetical protein